MEVGRGGKASVGDLWKDEEAQAGRRTCAGSPWTGLSDDVGVGCEDEGGVREREAC